MRVLHIDTRVDTCIILPFSAMARGPLGKREVVRGALHHFISHWGSSACQLLRLLVDLRSRCKGSDDDGRARSADPIHSWFSSWVEEAEKYGGQHHGISWWAGLFLSDLALGDESATRGEEMEEPHEGTLAEDMEMECFRQELIASVERPLHAREWLSAQVLRSTGGVVHTLDCCLCGKCCCDCPLCYAARRGDRLVVDLIMSLEKESAIETKEEGAPLSTAERAATRGVGWSKHLTHTVHLATFHGHSALAAHLLSRWISLEEQVVGPSLFGDLLWRQVEAWTWRVWECQWEVAAEEQRAMMSLQHLLLLHKAVADMSEEQWIRMWWQTPIEKPPLCWRSDKSPRQHRDEGIHSPSIMQWLCRRGALVPVRYLMDRLHHTDGAVCRMHGGDLAEVAIQLRHPELLRLCAAYGHFHLYAIQPKVLEELLETRCDDVREEEEEMWELQHLVCLYSGVQGETTITLSAQQPGSLLRYLSGPVAAGMTAAELGESVADAVFQTFFDASSSLAQEDNGDDAWRDYIVRGCFSALEYVPRHPLAWLMLLSILYTEERNRESSCTLAIQAMCESAGSPAFLCRIQEALEIRAMVWRCGSSYDASEQSSKRIQSCSRWFACLDRLITLRGRMAHCRSRVVSSSPAAASSELTVEAFTTHSILFSHDDPDEVHVKVLITGEPPSRSPAHGEESSEGERMLGKAIDTLFVRLPRHVDWEVWMAEGAGVGLVDTTVPLGKPYRTGSIVHFLIMPQSCGRLLFVYTTAEDALLNGSFDHRWGHVGSDSPLAWQPSPELWWKETGRDLLSSLSVSPALVRRWEWLVAASTQDPA